MSETPKVGYALILIVFIFAIFTMVFFINVFVKFSCTRKYIKMEVTRASGTGEYKYWKKELILFYIDCIPVIGRYITIYIDDKS